MSPIGPLSDLLLRSQTDERLCALARDGHQRAFTLFVERHAGLVAATAAAIGGRPGAEDIAQESLTRAWRALSSGATVTSPRAWLVTIVRHTALEMSRSVPSTSTEPTEDYADPRWAEAGLEQRLEARELLRLLAGLPENQRRALVGAEFAGIPRSELAAELGVSEGAVRQLTHRARNGLRVAMTALVPYPLASWAAAGGGVGGAAISGVAVKSGAALLAVGAIGGGVAIGVGHAHTPAAAPAALVHHDRTGEHRSASAAAAATLPAAAIPAAVTAAFAAERRTRGVTTRLSRIHVHAGGVPVVHPYGSRSGSGSGDETAAGARAGAAPVIRSAGAVSPGSDGSDAGDATGAPAHSRSTAAATDESDGASARPAATTEAPAPAPNPAPTETSTTAPESTDTGASSPGTGETVPAAAPPAS